MKLAWLEDFLALVDTGTFSAAAARRNVTQPAFSRRIRMLEQWLGVALVDRSGHRFATTPTAARFEPEIRALVGRTYDLRSRMQADTLADRRLALTAQHTLIVTHVPDWLQRFQAWEPHTAFQVHAGNMEECTQRLFHGHSDLMICYEAEGVDDGSAAQRELMERCVIGTDTMVPLAAAGTCQRRIDAGGDALEILNYPEQSFLGRVVRSHCLATLVRQRSLEIVCESAFAVGVKQMCLAGLGVAWLPRALVARELEDGTLQSLAESLPSPSLTISARRMRGNPNQALQHIWERLETDH